MSRVILRLTKAYKNLNSGEVAGFEEDEAAHILKHNGGERVAAPVAPPKPASPSDKK